jgi:glycine hydroxymethyltransferase
VLDVTPHGVTGKEAADHLEEAGLVVNKQVIPYDPKPPLVTSGIRLGTPALTTRGLREPQAREVAGWITEILKRPDATRLRKAVRAQVRAMARKFSIY